MCPRALYLGLALVWKLATLADIAHVEYPSLRYALLRESLPQQPRWLHHFLLRQHPRAPMDSAGATAFRVKEDVDTVEWIRVHRRHDPPGIIRSNRNQPQVERAAEIANLFKSWTVWEFESRVVIVDPWREFVDGPVASVAAKDE